MNRFLLSRRSRLAVMNCFCFFTWENNYVISKSWSGERVKLVLRSLFFFLFLIFFFFFLQFGNLSVLTSFLSLSFEQLRGSGAPRRTVWCTRGQRHVERNGGDAHAWGEAAMLSLQHKFLPIESKQSREWVALQQLPTSHVQQAHNSRDPNRLR